MITFEMHYMSSYWSLCQQNDHDVTTINRGDESLCVVWHLIKETHDLHQMNKHECIYHYHHCSYSFCGDIAIPMAIHLLGKFAVRHFIFIKLLQVWLKLMKHSWRIRNRFAYCDKLRKILDLIVLTGTEQSTTLQQTYIHICVETSMVWN